MTATTDMRVTDHAVRRYRERVSTKGTDEFVRDRLMQMERTGRDVQLKDRFRVISLLNNGCRDARYVKHGRFILVIEGDQIKTVHDGAADRWEYIYQ